MAQVWVGLDLRSQKMLRVGAVDFLSHWHQTGSIQAKETTTDEETIIKSCMIKRIHMHTTNVTNAKFICQVVSK